MAKPKTLSREEITITPLNTAELEAAVTILARGMRDNPLHIAAFSEDANARQRGLTRLFGSAARVLHWDRQMLAARDAAGTIVGVCGIALPGRCRPSASQRLRMLPAMVGLGPSTAGRVTQWMGPGHTTIRTSRTGASAPSPSTPDCRGAGLALV